MLACFAQIACTSLRVVADRQTSGAGVLSSAEPPVAPKDVVRVTTTDGGQLELRVTAIDATAITGITDARSDAVVIPVEQIQRIERSEVDGAKVLRNALVYVVVAVILGYALGRAAASKFTSAAP
ncbi:hypothetical protein FSC37_13330 [Piscinibacter aquaticus]|uniref:Uncharacterized protein n=1 Tax=Piscinibacter aquaticus TaxID=392597 RepID=A0A5C6U0S6_9BURK|nr:hypothetical protein FSC37_13330 [Piscinibacter aquaticus]